MDITINEGLTIIKTLQERHNELVSLRNENCSYSRRRLGVNADKEVTTYPTYDVVKLDSMITKIATAKRKLEAAIKHTNATTTVSGFDYDEGIVGEVSHAVRTNDPKAVTVPVVNAPEQ